jgi:hypothetical protein
MKYQKYSIYRPLFLSFFGLSIGNLDELKHYRWTQQFRLTEQGSYQIRELIIEATFIILFLYLGI